VLIEKSDFAKILNCYDQVDAFFYCDPPYVDFQSNGRYEAMVGDQLDLLFKTLANLKGKFLMSEEDHPEVCDRARDAGFYLKRVKTKYSIGGGASSKSRTEVLVANYQF
jgi:DNA adenine methylase